MIFNKSVLFACAFIFSSQVFSQVDTNVNPDVGYSSEVTLGLDGKSGSQDERNYTVGYLGRIVAGKDIIKFTVDYDYGESDGIKDNDELFTEVRWISNDFFVEKLDWESFVQYEYDKFADLDSREVVGSGVRWRKSSGDIDSQLDINLGAGLVAEQENAEASSENNTDIRGNFYGEAILKIKGLHPYTVYGKIGLQPVIGSMDDYRATLNSGIEFGISEDLSLKFDVEVDYESEPFENGEETETEYGVKLKYKF